MKPVEPESSCQSIRKGKTVSNSPVTLTHHWLPPPPSALSYFVSLSSDRESLPPTFCLLVLSAICRLAGRPTTGDPSHSSPTKTLLTPHPSSLPGQAWGRHIEGIHQIWNEKNLIKVQIVWRNATCSLKWILSSTRSMTLNINKHTNLRATDPNVTSQMYSVQINHLINLI